MGRSKGGEIGGRRGAVHPGQGSGDVDGSGRDPGRAVAADTFRQAVPGQVERAVGRGGEQAGQGAQPVDHLLGPTQRQRGPAPGRHQASATAVIELPAEGEVEEVRQVPGEPGDLLEQGSEDLQDDLPASPKGGRGEGGQQHLDALRGLVVEDLETPRFQLVILQRHGLKQRRRCWSARLPPQPLR